MGLVYASSLLRSCTDVHTMVVMQELGQDSARLTTADNNCQSNTRCGAPDGLRRSNKPTMIIARQQARLPSQA